MASPTFFFRFYQAKGNKLSDISESRVFGDPEGFGNPAGGNGAASYDFGQYCDRKTEISQFRKLAITQARQVFWQQGREEEKGGRPKIFQSRMTVGQIFFY